MIYKICFFIFAIIKVNISLNISDIIDGNGIRQIYDCVYHGARCNTNLEFSCCESNNICKLIRLESNEAVTACTKLVHIGESCNNDIECANVAHARCNQSKKCECMDDYVALKPTKCAPLLGGYCEKDEDCILFNSICTNYHCTCKPSYISRPQYQCVPASIGMNCTHDDDCEDFRHVKCTINKICACRPHHILHNNVTCLPLLDTYCENNERCLFENSVCVENKCQCKSGYMATSRQSCAKSPLNRTCSTIDDCVDLDRSKCSDDKKCVCQENNIIINNAICMPSLGGICQTNIECMIGHSVCNNNICQCQPGYEPNSDNECRASLLGKSCEDSFDCNNIWHLKCSKDKICICKTNHVVVNNASCIPNLGALCLSGDQCKPDNSVCINYECQCKPTFERVDNRHCIPSSLGKSCKNNYDCGDYLHSMCSSNKICVCRENQMVINNATCVPLLGGTCKYNELCRVDNSDCINNECQCINNYKAMSNNICVRSEPEFYD